MVAGDIVNTASRIQGIAEPGQVLVGEATRRATEATIVYEDAGLHELKGKAGLVPAWRALRVVSGARGTLKSQGLEAPFVGRDRELRLIKDLFHDSESGGRAHLISVTGIAGIGKSRLAWEFYKYFDGIAQLTYWHRGRCLSYGEGVTYWALADMVRMRARIFEEEEPASARAKLQEIVVETFADEADRRFVEPRLAHLLGLEEGVGYERDDLFAAWRLFFERLSDTYPVVMSFEDMQWADDSLLDFIEYLLDASRSSPILVLTHARPELHERRPTWGPGGETSRLSISSPFRQTPWKSCSRVSCRACPRRCAARSSSAPRASRSTPWRRCGCSSTADCSSRRAPSTAPRRRSTRSRFRRRCTRSSPRASTACRRKSGGCSRTPPSSARRSPSARSRHSRGSQTTRSSPCSRRSCARRCSRSRRTRARRSTASTVSSRSPSVTSRTRRSRSASGVRATSPPPRTSRRRSPTTTRSSKCSPRTTSTRIGRSPTRRMPGRSRRRRARCSGVPGSGPLRLPRRARRNATSRRRPSRRTSRSYAPSSTRRRAGWRGGADDAKRRCALGGSARRPRAGGPRPAGGTDRHVLAEIDFREGVHPRRSSGWNGRSRTSAATSPTRWSPRPPRSWGASSC